MVQDAVPPSFPPSSPRRAAARAERWDLPGRAQGGSVDARDGLRHAVRVLDGAAGTTRALDAGVRLPRF